MVDLVNTTNGITRLNKQNYRSWRSCIKSYLEGQDLWGVIDGNDERPPDDHALLPEWKVKAGKVMYVLKSTIEDKLLQQIEDADTPNTAWDTLERLIDVMDGIGDTPIRAAEMVRAGMLPHELYKAAKKGDVSRLSAIRGAHRTEEEATNAGHGDFLRKTQYGNNNILHIAARARRDKFVAEVLCHFRFLSEQVNSQGHTPLLVAARFGHLEVVKKLTNSATENGTNPSQEATLENQTNSYWRVINSKGITVTTALHEALRNGHDKVALYLFRKIPEMADFDTPAGESPLFLAAKSRCELFIRDVLRTNRPYSTKGPDGLNALHAARDCSGIGDTPIRAAEMVRAVVMVRATKLPHKLYKAAKEGDVSCLSGIEEANRTEEDARTIGDGKFLRRTQYGDNNILHIAARAGRDKFVAQVLRRFRFLSVKPNSQGYSPLLVAARFGHLKVVKELTRSATENPPNCCWWVSCQSVLWSCNSDRDGTVSNVEEVPSHWKVINSDGITVTTALHEALRNGHDKVALHLFGLIPEIAESNNLAGESPLFLAAESCCELFMLAVLRSEGSEQRYSTDGPDGLNALHAARDCSGKTISELIRKKPNLLTEVDNRGKAAIHHAIEADYESLLDQILNNEASIALLRDRDGYTPLLKASIRGRWDFCMKILEKCPESIEARDPRGRNALHLCRFWCSYRLGLKFFGIPEIRKLLNVADDEGNTPLHLAVKQNDYEKAMLLTSWESIYLGAVNKDGLTALDLCESNWKRLGTQRLMWNHLRKCGAPRGRSPNKHAVPFGGLKGTMGSTKEDTERYSQTTSLAAALIATLTFAAALTMPGGYDDLGGAISLKKAALMIFIFSDTLAMCCSITVVSLLWRAMGVTQDLKIVSNNASVQLLRIALYATLVAFMSGVFALIAPKVLWVAILVCVISAMVPCLFLPDMVRRAALFIMLVKTWIQIKRCLPCVQSLISWWIKIKWCLLPCVQLLKSCWIKIKRGLCCVQSPNRRGSPATTCC